MAPANESSEEHDGRKRSRKDRKERKEERRTKHRSHKHHGRQRHSNKDTDEHAWTEMTAEELEKIQREHQQKQTRPVHDFVGPLPQPFRSRDLTENDGESGKHRRLREATEKFSTEDDHDSGSFLGPLPPSLAVIGAGAQPGSAVDESDFGGPCRPMEPNRAEHGQSSHKNDNVAQLAELFASDLPENAEQTTDDDDDVIGPRLSERHNDSHEAEDAISIAKDIDRRSEAMRQRLADDGKPKKLEREEWMLVPPTAKKKGSGAVIDSSMWTESPKSAAQKPKTAPKVKTVQGPTPSQVMKEEAIAKAVEEYNTQHRGESLLSMHRAKHKSGKQKPARPERVPFNRDTDLTRRCIEPAQQSRMVAEAARLNLRFGHGSSRFL